MLGGRALATVGRRCRTYATARAQRLVPSLPDASLETFRTQSLEPATPALLPRGTFSAVPAISKWFTTPGGKRGGGPPALNRSYLSAYSSAIVPVEITNHDRFARLDQPLYFFLECVHSQSSRYLRHPSRYFSAYVPGARAIKRTHRSNDFFSAASLSPPTARVYLAQASLPDLPRGMRDDLPTPELVLKAGKGDIYDSSIWLGQAPTYTPLHRDPNPNLFVQLAGRKLVRLYPPRTGQGIFARVQEKIGGNASAVMRGEEMMQGTEKKVLEEEVWDDEGGGGERCWEAEVRSGDGLFIPKGWWHSIKGVGEGMTGSVNWWFR